VAAALLSERDPFRSAEHVRGRPWKYGDVRSRSDIVDRVLALQVFHASGASGDPTLALHPGGATNVLRASDQLFDLAEFPRASRAESPELALMHALLEAFPDRLAKLRPGTQDRALMVGGRGVRIHSGSRVRGEPLFLAIDINDTGGEARVRLVSAVDRDWLTNEKLSRREELFFNPTTKQVEARLRTYWIDLLIEETPVAISDWTAAAEILAQQARQQFERVLPDPDTTVGNFLARVRWLAGAMPELELASLSDDELQQLLPELCLGLRSIDDVRNADWLAFLQAKVGFERLAEIDRLAPSHLELPNGNRHGIEYKAGTAPILAVRIQELFGLSETPKLCGGRVLMLLHLLGPNYRPQQITADLASFWQNGYPEVKKELRRRYPKHSWPDDPVTAEATKSGMKPRK